MGSRQAKQWPSRLHAFLNARGAEWISAVISSYNLSITLEKRFPALYQDWYQTNRHSTLGASALLNQLRELTSKWQQLPPDQIGWAG